MRKRMLIPASVCMLAMLTSCSLYQYDCKIFINNGDLILSLKIDQVMRNNSKIKGSISVKEGVDLNDSYQLAYTHDEPFGTIASYSETTLYSVNKQTLASATEDVSFIIVVDLENTFPKESEDKVVYFVFHQYDFKINDFKTYSYFKFAYSWSGNSVKLSN